MSKVHEKSWHSVLQKSRLKRAFLHECRLLYGFLPQIGTALSFGVSSMRLLPLNCLGLLLLVGISPTSLEAQESPAKPVEKEKPATAAPAQPKAVAKTPAAKPVAEKEKANSADLAAIRQTSQEFVAAFDKADAAAVAALWTEDGDYIDEAGQTYVGREAIQKGYEVFFAEHPGTKIQLVIDSLRLLSPTAAVEDGRAILNPAPSGAPGTSKYTAIHVKIDGKWLVSTIRDYRVESASGYRNIADLEWLIGTWTAESPGSKLESVCTWVANKSFVQRTYTTKHTDGTSSSGVQLIGFNPMSGQIQSWNFSSDGGLAVGVWKPIENGWSAELTGALGDGTPTHAINLLMRLDDKAYAWQSVQRTAGDVALPNTEEVILRRSETK